MVAATKNPGCANALTADGGGLLLSVLVVRVLYRYGGLPLP